MIRNMGTTDRSVRVVIGVAALVVAFLVGWGSTLATILSIVLIALGAAMLVTAAIGYCPTYLLLGISTNPTLHRTSKREAKVA